jgi:Cu(I)/Ag(I) efflux system membrane fusion protein
MAAHRARPRALWAAIKVVELRLRFVAVMAATGLVFAYGETLWNIYEKWTRPPRKGAAAAAGVEFFCPMHPNVVLDQPAGCPICGMPLARRRKGEVHARFAGRTTRVTLRPSRVAQARIRTVAVEFGEPAGRLSTVGFVGFDEARRVVVSSDARGRLRVDRLHVSSEGVSVRAGRRLAELSGYDLAQAFRVFHEARRALRGPAEPSNDPRRTPTGDLGERVRLAEQALEVLGVRREQIEAVAADDGPGERLPIVAPIDGYVIRKYVHEGQYVSEGTPLFEIADLGRVWVDAEVFEDQLGRIGVGRPVEVTVPSCPGEVFAGSVALLAPALDPATRTASVRVELDNPGHRLRPGMFATVSVSLTGPQEGGEPREQQNCPVTGARLGSMGDPVSVQVEGRTIRVCCAGCLPKLQANPATYLARSGPSAWDRVLRVPESAVIDTGLRRVVYVEAEPGVYEGREVVLGTRSGDHFPVLEGLSPGDRVAVAGAFLIDAESRLDPGTGPAEPAVGPSVKSR